MRRSKTKKCILAELEFEKLAQDKALLLDAVYGHHKGLEKGHKRHRNKRLGLENGVSGGRKGTGPGQPETTRWKQTSEAKNDQVDIGKKGLGIQVK